MPNIPGLDNIDWFGIAMKTAEWIGWGLLAILAFGGVYFIFYWLSFKYKMTIWNIYGSGKDGVLSVSKPKKNKAKQNKDGSEWILMWPLFKKKSIQAFDSEFIYPGNICYGFDLNGMIMPGRININQTEDKIRLEVNPVPFHVRNWQSLQHKKNAIEYAEQNWWENNKSLVYGVITVFICCALAAATIYFTYQFAGGLQPDLRKLTAAIDGIGVIPSK